MTRRTFLAAGFGGASLRYRALSDDDLLKNTVIAQSGMRIESAVMLDALAHAQVVFIGEQHDDPSTHRVERLILERLHSTIGNRMTLAMEMFERDGQAALDDYLSGRTDEADMAKRVRLWPNYPTDYRPLIEYARAHRIPVVGTNAPGRIVRQVGKEGWVNVLAKLPVVDRAFVASYVNAPEGDEYARRFADIIGNGHGDGKPMDPAMVRRFYEAQCLRDDTMAESIARILDSNRFVLHVNGGFHSDAALGTVQRLRWRRPLRTPKIAVVKIIPHNGTMNSTPERSEADFLVFVPDTRPSQVK